MTNINISTILRDVGLHYILMNIKNTIISKLSLDLCCTISIRFVFLQCVLKQVAKLVTKRVTKTI
nr:MAG TPA: hypothetical protein [Caudoviricetes sp.]